MDLGQVDEVEPQLLREDGDQPRLGHETHLDDRAAQGSALLGHLVASHLELVVRDQAASKQQLTELAPRTRCGHRRASPSRGSGHSSPHG